MGNARCTHGKLSDDYTTVVGKPVTQGAGERIALIWILEMSVRVQTGFSWLMMGSGSRLFKHGSVLSVYTEGDLFLDKLNN
jgi:hypothetical protein